MVDANVIPAMTDPLGKYWPQPEPSLMAVDATHAVMELTSFKMLSEYSASIPSGVYAGKMWKSTKDKRRWFLRWYALDEGNTEFCSINTREILIA
ncbi:MAG: hypothetical protein V4525_11070 [Pseudomonadota bacterium]